VDAFLGVALVVDKIYANQELTDLVASTGSRLQDLHGIGPSGAARLLGDIGDISRFASRARFASWNGPTEPMEAARLAFVNTAKRHVLGSADRLDRLPIRRPSGYMPGVSGTPPGPPPTP
jgi:transposase IS116/IS110/IS902 family protein